MWNDFPIKRKTLPEIAKVVGLDQEQSLITSSKSPWSVKGKDGFNFADFKGRKIYLIIDETGDKEGKKDRLCKSAIFGKLGR